MANDANVFKNSLTAAGYVTPEEWSREIEQVAREKSIFRQLSGSIIVMDRVGVPGNTEHIQKNVALSAADITDGNSVAIEAVSFTQIDVTAAQFGKGVQITLKQLRDQLPTVRADVILNLGTALNEAEETKIITELLTTSSAAVYPNGKVTGDIAATDVFEKDLVIDGKTAMRVDKRKGMFLVVHPNQYGDLSKESTFIDASQLGGDRVTKEGLIGRFYGLDVYESTNITTTSEGVGSAVTVYNALLLGERAMVIMDKKNPTLEFNRNLIQDLSVTFIAYQDAGYQLLNDESVRVLKSA
jgi:N4-gp56 family major capsid protein